MVHWVPDWTGPDWTRLYRTGLDRTRLDRTGPDWSVVVSGAGVILAYSVSLGGVSESVAMFFWWAVGC